MPPTEQALALVVRGTDWSETSRIATNFALFYSVFRNFESEQVTDKGTTAMV